MVNNKKPINEKIFIELYKSGKTDLELSIMFDVGERTIQRYVSKLRIKGKIKFRNQLPVTKTVSRKNTIQPVEPINWKINKTRKKGSKVKKPFSTYLVVADTHVPYVNAPAVKSVLKLMDDMTFDGFILLGDYMDMSPISHWLKNKRKTMENQRMKDDYIAGNTLLDEFDKRLPENCDKRFFYGNHCLDEKTEVLTERGWMLYGEIKKSDKIFSLNPETEIAEWTSIKSKFKKSFKGQLNQIETSKISLVATDDHKLFYKDKYSRKYKFELVKNIKKRNYLIPRTSKSNKPEYPIKDDMLKLIGWLLTDGSITKDKYNYVKFYQRESKVGLIVDILDRLKIKYGVYKRKRDIKFICGRKVISSEVQYTLNICAQDSRKLLQYINKEKEIPYYIDQLSKRQFDIFLNSVIDGDGSRHKSAPKTSLMLYGKKKFLEQIQILGLKNEYGMSLSEYREGDYRLNIIPRLSYNLYNFGDIVKKVDYNGFVWDLTIEPYHNFLIRRNGKCHFTGNCDWYNQLIEEYPALEGLLEPKTELKLEERGYKVYEEINHIEKIGKLAFTHGIYTGMHFVKKHIDMLKTNCIFGHLHSPRTRFEPSPAREIAIAGYGLGCLCDLSPDYMKNRPNGWVHGFGVVYFYNDEGYFDVDIKRIVKGKYIFNNKLYDGNI